MHSINLWGVAAGEALGTFLLALIFGVMAFYNSGIVRSFVGVSTADPFDDDDDGEFEYYYGPSETYVFPPWLQAFVVLISLWIVYRVGSRLAKRHLHLNPFISTVLIMMEYVDNPTLDFFWALLSLLWVWFAQIIGTLGGAAIVYAFSSDGSMASVAQFLGGDGSTTNIQYNLAGVADIAFGTLGLMLIAKVAKDNTTNTSPGKCSFERWALAISGFYFFYMLFFWTHSKATIDFIRTGWYCVFTEADKTSASCSQAGTLFEFDAGLYLWHFIWQAVVIIIVLIIAALVKLYNRNNKQ